MLIVKGGEAKYSDQKGETSEFLTNSTSTLIKLNVYGIKKQSAIKTYNSLRAGVKHVVLSTGLVFRKEKEDDDGSVWSQLCACE